ncbi:28147_t:CDS:1 [Dentiscutata erythropus]|uniref:28147_t:CDS:1 n=1 Tax=Dentiscutata erythropus TaxID=1348616 RepID=A0A9N9HNS1_9GLOM|nr:28147_t:CDS:1 [Dentiscutata erythropus]
MPKHKTVRPRIYRDKNGLISSILVRGNITASFKFYKKNILKKSDKQIVASAATVILQTSEEKTNAVTFKLENVTYNKLRKNLTRLTATRGTIESHFHKTIEKMENLTIDLELKH